eukprot:TRINITY_DN44392_c0_g1_i1.p1 TRINITY_DN44392_c0_g1~~TRINITY_DN44392_c0_g1_i1.p1  ORF type:complete len:467 (+),score=92.41 TRINITY_DN44392_c0_g1_i1:156-1556(+)
MAEETETKVEVEETTLAPEAEEKAGEAESKDTGKKKGKKTKWQKVDNVVDYYNPKPYEAQKGGKDRKGKGKGDRDDRDKGKGKGDRDSYRGSYGRGAGQADGSRIDGQGEAGPAGGKDRLHDDIAKAQGFAAADGSGPAGIPGADGDFNGKGKDGKGKKGDRMKGCGKRDGGFEGKRGVPGGDQSQGKGPAGGAAMPFVGGPSSGGPRLGGKDGMSGGKPGMPTGGLGVPRAPAPASPNMGPMPGASGSAPAMGMPPGGGPGPCGGSPGGGAVPELRPPVPGMGKGMPMVGPAGCGGMPIMAPCGGFGMPYQFGAMPYQFSGVPMAYMPYFPVSMPTVQPGAPGGPLPTGMPGQAPVPVVPISPEQRQTLVNQVRSQIEYYFGQENLIKDIWLRSRAMDTKGYVDIRQLSGFRKVNNMTQDLSIVIDALSSSDMLEMNPERSAVRLKAGWEQWILSPDDKAAAPSS